ncbi:MAG: adenylate/guanylate cyclase domain-containing protein, partial [bacterium]
MTEEQVKRKLIAIFSADVEGYSRLMDEDEIWTIRTLESFRKIFAALIQKYRGRIVDSPGDNILAEFGSVVDAVQSAVEIQEALRSKNAEFPENRQMLFRIGINLGDVIEEEDKIYGDGVNIAARIESLAEGGGICISGSAYEQIENKLALGYEYIGKHIVKNIRKPIHVYKVPVGFEPKASKRGAKRRAKCRRLLWGTLLIAAILIVSGTVWHFILRPVYAPKDKVQKEEPEEKNLKAQLVFWETIKDSEDRNMYEEYLRKFPDGIFAGLAQLNVEKYSKYDTTQKKDSGRTKDKMHEKMPQGPRKMRQKPTKEEATLKKSPKEDYEIVFWRSIENSKNIAVFQEYLNRFPNGTFVGLAKIKIKDLAEDKSKKLAVLTKPKDEEKKKIPTVAEESLKFDTQPSKESPKKAEPVKEKKDVQIEETKKLKDIEKKKDEKQIALHLPQKREVEKVVKTSQPLEQLRPDNVIEIAVFPWHVKLQFREGWGGISSKALKAGAIDGLRKFLTENKLVIPRFSYYDLGKEINENN